MKWNYCGNPAESKLDEARFLLGDTERDKPQVSDDEVQYALDKYDQDATAAAAELCGHLSRKYSRLADCSVGDVSRSCSQIAKAYKDRADELSLEVEASSGLVIPSFGGLSQAEKITLKENTDAVQPAFEIGMDDNPGAPTERDDPLRR